MYVAAAGAPPFALWGELMTTRALAQGAAGAVLDGYMRDTREIRAMSLPVFARGSYAQDQRGRGRVVAYREPVRIAEVAVRPGDLIVGDDDGVLVVPSDVASECVEKALEKRRMENIIAQEIEAGLSTTEAWEKYGVM